MKLVARIVYLVAEGARSLHTHLLLTTMTSLTIAVTLVLFGLFAALYQGIETAAATFHGQLRVVVFLEDGVSSAQTDALREWLAGRPEIAEVTYHSKEDALTRFQEGQPEAARLVDLLGANPLPASFTARLADTAHGVDAVKALAAEAAGFAGVDTVRYGEGWLAGLLGLSRWVRIVGGGVGVLLLVATLFIVSNAVRLSIYARREEIAIMRLIGATYGFIRSPFYLESVVAGIVGGAIAAAILAVLQRLGSYLLAPVAAQGSLFTDIALPTLARGQVAALVVAGVVFGVAGCWTSLGRFLRE